MSFLNWLRGGKPARDLAVGCVENKDGRFLILENDGIGGHLKRGDRWEPHFTKIVRGLVEPGTVAVDAGANMVKELKILGNTRPVVMLSSVGDDLSMTADASQLGLAGILQKPVDEDRLVNLLRSKLS